MSSALRMKPTCLCLSIFKFDSECFFNLHVFILLFNKHHRCLFLSIFVFDFECFFNLHVFNLLFNKRHLYNSVSHGSQLLQEFFCVFGHFVLFKLRIVNREKIKSKLNLWVRLNQIPSSVVSALVKRRTHYTIVRPIMNGIRYWHLIVPSQTGSVPGLSRCLQSAEKSQCVVSKD